MGVRLPTILGKAIDDVVKTLNDEVSGKSSRLSMLQVFADTWRTRSLVRRGQDCRPHRGEFERRHCHKGRITDEKLLDSRNSASAAWRT